MMHFSRFVVLFGLLGSLLVLPWKAFAGVQADINIELKEKGKSKNVIQGEYFYDETAFRLDHAQEGHKQTIILDTKNNIFFLVNHKDKNFIKMENKDQNREDLEKLFSDQKLRDIKNLEKEGWVVKKKATEKYEGYMCDVYEMNHPKKKLEAKVWIPKNIQGFPLRSINKDENGNITEMKLSNIKEQKIAASTFQPPKGYEPVVMPAFAMDPAKLQKEMERIMSNPNMTQEQKQQALQKMMQGAQ